MPGYKDNKSVSKLLVTCYYCKKLYEKPKILPCYHTFCEDCISDNTPDQGLTHHCVLCGGQSILPKEGATKLKENCYIEKLLLKTRKQTANQIMSEYGHDLHSSGNGETSPLSSSHKSDFTKDQITCHVHANRPGVNYCRQCHLVVCFDCAKSDHVEHIELVDSMHTISEECERLMLEQVTALEAQITQLGGLLGKINDVSDSLRINSESAKKSVNKCFDEIEKVVAERRGELLRHIENEYLSKEALLNEQYVNVQDMAQQLQEGVDLVTNFTDETNHDTTQKDDENRINSTKQMFLLYQQISHHMDDLNNNFTYEDEACKTTNFPVENDFIEFHEETNPGKIKEIISNTGKILSCHVRPEMCCVSGECLTTGQCIIGEENIIILTTKTAYGEIESSGNVVIDVDFKLVELSKNAVKMRNNYQNRTQRQRPHSVTYSSTSPSTLSRSRENLTQRTPLKDMFFRSPKTETKKPLVQRTSKRSLFKELVDLPLQKVTHVKGGTYELCLSPKQPGKYSLTITICGELLQNQISLQAVYLQSQSSRLSPTPDIRNKGVRQRGMKSAKSTPAKAPSIENDLLLTIGSQGRGEGEFTSPQGVSVDHLGRILIADSTNQAVQVVAINTKTENDIKVKFVSKFGQKGRNSGQIQRPTGVLGLPDGRIAVADYDNKCVSIYKQNGNYESRIGAGKLLGPKGICLDKNGHLVVVDNKLCEVFVFQLNGRIITRFGSRGTGDNNLAGPHFVAVNEENNLFVTDFYNHCVKVFTPAGKYLGAIGKAGEGCGQFNAPTGVAIDHDGNLIVADWGNSRIQVFDKEGSFVAYVNSSENPLYGPQDVAITRSGNIVVADAGNHCVKLYKYLQ